MRTTSLKTTYLTIPELKEAIARVGKKTSDKSAGSTNKNGSREGVHKSSFRCRIPADGV